MGMNDNNIPTCDGWCNDANKPTHIGSKGYIYCQPCAIARRGDSGERTRRMAVWELKLIAQGEPLPSYKRTRKPKYTTIVPTAPEAPKQWRNNESGDLYDEHDREMFIDEEMANDEDATGVQGDIMNAERVFNEQHTRVT